ncbi:MAG: hypothetical protein B6D64_05760 [Bacteroidetes bacterium 4484_276]|nr:MAG: hypothetical protein B6D64_05760 [Bacteroidetes bacterium 4484_276]
MKFKVVIEKGEDGYFIAHCPTLRSCWSQGKTKEDVLMNIQEAIELYLEPEVDEFSVNTDQEICELVL